MTEQEKKVQESNIIGILSILLLAVFSYGIYTCNPSDPYKILHRDFAGMPKKEDIKSMMEVVMKRHHFPIHEDNILRFGISLVALRNQSLAGVTEMDILKHMYQYGDTTKSLGEQCTVSAYILEKTK